MAIMKSVMPVLRRLVRLALLGAAINFASTCVYVQNCQMRTRPLASAEKRFFRRPASVVRRGLQEEDDALTQHKQLVEDMVYGREAKAGNVVKMLARTGEAGIWVRGVVQRFSTLIEAIKAAGLQEKLDGPGSYTVFAPTDEAFEKYFVSTGQTREEFLKHADLYRVIKNHIVDGTQVRRKQLLKQDVTTMAGQVLSAKTSAKLR
eukprot:TRINITY_DN45612_c0_g1_i1.p1 TRINITY_DN45612_c0_g1~~TRINITY_DN45612_c0_g1_i1.p1  ORF type:complete len:205 (+),score=34.95 TRINITY_DN45612_c0_g1_i1:164-778(+)